MEDQPELFDPELLWELRYEIALLYAEELLHKLQRRIGGPVAEQADEEVDIAAYLDREGMYLSDHFVTRYPTRKEWFMDRYPERAEGVRAFAAEHNL